MQSSLPVKSRKLSWYPMFIKLNELQRFVNDSVYSSHRHIYLFCNFLTSVKSQFLHPLNVHGNDYGRLQITSTCNVTHWCAAFFNIFTQLKCFTVTNNLITVLCKVTKKSHQVLHLHSLEISLQHYSICALDVMFFITYCCHCLTCNQNSASCSNIWHL